jgi:hypothetical protein
VDLPRAIRYDRRGGSTTEYSLTQNEGRSLAEITTLLPPLTDVSTIF